MTTRTAVGWWNALFPLVLLLPVGSPTVEAADAEASQPAAPAGPQVPVALAWGPNGTLRVALRDARQLVTVDPESGRVLDRLALPVRPSSLAALNDGTTLLVGGMDGDLVAVKSGVPTPLLRANGRGPVKVVALDGGRAAVASPWDLTVRVVDVADGRVERTIELPFAAGALRARPGRGLIAAAAFGGKLADIHLESGRVRTRTLEGVNLSALAFSGDGKELLVGHMAQYGQVPVTSTNIDWGLVLSSRLSAVRLSEFDKDAPGADGGVVAGRQLTLDGSVHGAADPSALAVSPDGALVMIALSGAHQVLKNDRRLGSSGPEFSDLLPLGHNQGLETVEVGRSPVDVVFDPSGKTVVTADSMSDTLTVVRVADLSVVRTIRLGPDVVRRTAAQRGEAAFRDGRLALDRWMSCASCHPSGHTNGLNFDTLGDGGYGAAKNTPTLLGVGPTGPFAWTGRFPSLAAQVHQSLQTSLRGSSSDEQTVADLSAYLATLPPPPARRPADDPSVRRGAVVFEARGCQGCHRPPHYTSGGVKDVGLDDGPGGHRAFNPPSLRGVGWTAPYFHDGHAASLDEVLKTHTPAARSPLSTADLADLKAFLESL